MNSILDILEALDIPIDDDIDDNIDYMEQDLQLLDMLNIDQWYLQV